MSLGVITLEGSGDRYYIKSIDRNRILATSDPSGTSIPYVITYFDGRWRWPLYHNRVLKFGGSTPRPSLTEIGDPVVVYSDNTGYLLKIKRITPDNIIITGEDEEWGYNLIPQNGKWVFQNNPKIKIAFEGIPPSPIKDLPDLVLEQTMQYMNDQELRRFCLARQDIEICRDRDNIFWANKLKQIWPEINLEDRGNKSYQEWYFSPEISELTKLVKGGGEAHWNFHEQDAIKKDYLSAIKYYDTHISKLDQNEINFASFAGKIRILKWLSESNRFPDQDGANQAAWNNQLEVLEWLNKHNIRPNRNGASNAASVGHTHILDWLAAKDIYPDVRGIYLSTQRGHLNSIKWIFEHVPDLLTRIEKYVLESYLDSAVMFNKLDVVQFWVERGYYPTEFGLQRAKEERAIDVLNYLRIHPKKS